MVDYFDTDTIIFTKMWHNVLFRTPSNSNSTLLIAAVCHRFSLKHNGDVQIITKKQKSENKLCLGTFPTDLEFSFVQVYVKLRSRAITRKCAHMPDEARKIHALQIGTYLTLWSLVKSCILGLCPVNVVNRREKYKMDLKYKVHCRMNRFEVLQPKK